VVVVTLVPVVSPLVAIVVAFVAVVVVAVVTVPGPGRRRRRTTGGEGREPEQDGKGDATRPSFLHGTHSGATPLA
jgi:hypothetical protein